MPNNLGFLVLTSTIAVGCVSGGGVRPEPFPHPSPSPAAASSPASVQDSLVLTATGLAGIPYRRGGETPHGFDCSGFTRFVFAQHGVTLPRLTEEQYREGRVIPAGDVRPGDLVFFTTVAPGASHVGVAITRDEFVHAPSERGVVRIERLSERYWASRYLGARRVVE
jgi:cell wall-associated NlpC family hydrolase